MHGDVVVRLIFAGLVSLGIVEDAGGPRGVATVLRQEHHRPSLHVLGDGRLETSSGQDCTAWLDSKLREAGNELKFTLTYEGSAGAFTPVLDVRDRDHQAPEDAAEARDLSWIPNLDAHVLGRARLSGECANKTGACEHARARFFFDRGEAATCHLIHQPVDVACTNGGQVYTYRVPGMGRQAVGTAFEIESTLASPRLVAEIRHASGRLDRLTCDMSPGAGTEFTLVVVNEPPDSSGVAGGCEPPERLGHHAAHYDLINLFYGKWYTAAPHSPELSSSMFVGSCEQEVMIAANRVNSSLQPPGVFPPVNFPHSASACDSAMIP